MKNNKYEYILFDLDGTLLGMDTNKFVDAYLKLMTIYLANNGYDAEKVVSAIRTGISAMYNNDGLKSNEIILAESFSDVYGNDFKKYSELMDYFYIEKFSKLKNTTYEHKEVPTLIKKLKENGYKLIIATNPMFPKIATKQRIEWAGLNPDDFEFFTTYENEYFSKPNLKYYESILNRIGASAESCLMVGNDAEEDMCAKKLGLDVYLINHNILNRKNLDISNFNQGTWEDFSKFIFE